MRSPSVRAGEGASDRESRIGTAGVVAECTEPAQRRLDLSDPGEHRRMPGHQRGSQLRVVARQRVPDGRHRLVVRGPPPCGPRVQLRHEVGLGGLQVAVQYLGEQVVEPVPAAAAVEQGGGVRPPGDGVAQVPAEDIEDRRPPQHLAQRIEHVAAQVVDEVPGRPGTRPGQDRRRLE